MDIKKIIKQKKKNSGLTPLFFNLNSGRDSLALSKLFKSKKVLNIIDNYKDQLKEYFEITNPLEAYTKNFEKKFQEFLSALISKKPLFKQGQWVYFSWNGSLVHILNDQKFFVVRTGRNQNLITKTEQQKFYNASVGIAGLSVGNSIALAIVLQGGARHIKLADFDTLALSNTNRIITGVDNLGIKKVVLTARQIYELNPYAKIEIFTDGLTKKNVKKFFNGLDIIVDEIDNLSVKYLIREYAKNQRIPVVMAADNSDGGVIDIERYDQNPKTKFFHGRIGNVSFKELKSLNKFGIGKMITKLVGVENITERMQDSLINMGKTVVSWPQLGGAALLNGSAVAYCVRKIICNQPLQNNRAIISLDEKLSPNYFSKTEKSRRSKATKAFKQIFGL